MTNGIKCPKCKSLAFIVTEDRSIAVKCVHCGFLKFIEQATSDGMVISNRTRATIDNLPRKTTKLHSCLMALEANAPAKTGDLAEVLDQSNSVTASQLAVLGLRGLVITLQNNRGVSGGSIWDIPDTVRRIL